MPKKIPLMNSVSELAHFWDNHDLTDFEDELKEVTGVFADILKSHNKNNIEDIEEKKEILSCP